MPTSDILWNNTVIAVTAKKCFHQDRRVKSEAPGQKRLMRPPASEVRKNFAGLEIIFLIVMLVCFMRPSGPAKAISFTEVKHGCVRLETGWATFQINDQKSAHSAVLRKGR